MNNKVFVQELELTTAEDVLKHLIASFPDSTSKVDSIEQLYMVKGQQSLINHLKVKLQRDAQLN